MVLAACANVLPAGLCFEKTLSRLSISFHLAGKSGYRTSDFANGTTKAACPVSPLWSKCLQSPGRSVSRCAAIRTSAWYHLAVRLLQRPGPRSFHDLNLAACRSRDELELPRRTDAFHARQRRAIRRAPAAQVAGLHRRGGAHSGAGHRRQHGGLDRKSTSLNS